MTALILDDAREYIFPLFLVKAEGNGVYLESRQFAGTAFFVSRRGDAITAGHVLPDPSAFTPEKRLIAVVQRGEASEICWVNHGAYIPEWDLGLLKINLEETKFLSLRDDSMYGGTDVQVVGIPNHEVWASGKEMRILKGHVTLASKLLELSFAVPLGMSGSPVFCGQYFVGYATGSIKSEEIEDYSEEIGTLSDHKEQITITKTIRSTHYGLAVPFSRLREQTFPVLSNQTLFQLLEDRNREP